METLRNLPNILRDSLLENFDGLGSRSATKQDLKEIMEMVVMEIDSRFKAIDIRNGSFNSNNNGVVTSSSTNDRPTQYVAAEQVYHYWKNKNRLICDSSCTTTCHNNNSIRAENSTCQLAL